MAYTAQVDLKPWDLEVEIEIKTRPVALKPEEPFYQELHGYIHEFVLDIMNTWKVRYTYISGDGNEERNKSTIEAFTKRLTDEMQIPINVQMICQAPSYDLTNKLYFGVEVTQETLEKYNNRGKEELSNLINDVFGS